MKRKTIMILLALTIVLFSIASVSASDADDIAVSNEDDSQIGLSTQIDNDDETLSEENTQEVLSADDEGTYNGLKNEIGNGGNISLTKSYYRYTSTDDKAINITTPGVIDGKGAVIDMAGSLNTHVFDVNVTGKLTIKNLTIINVNSYDAGAIFFLNGNATIIDCNFYNNSAEEGGAIFFNGTSLTVENCIFTNNTAYNMGGAIALNSSVNFTSTNCIFINNTATGNGADAGGQGGAIASVYTCTFFNIDKCVFTNNTAVRGKVIEEPFSASFGGAMSLAGGANITNSRFNNNFASEGGAIVSSWAYPLLISKCNFTNNSAEDGGAFYNDGSNVTIMCSTFDGNKADNFGGAISNNLDYKLTINNCTFTGNNAGYGSVIFNERIYDSISVLVIEDSTFTGNGGTDDHSIYNKGNLTLSGNTVDNIIYNTGIINSTTNAIVLANKTVDAKCGETITLNATLKDDNGNLIEDENLQFTVDGAVVPVKSSYANGLYTATYIPDKVGQKVVSAVLDYDTTVKTATIIVNIVETKLSANAVTTTYNVAKNLVVTLKDAYGNAVSNAKITINLNGKSIKVTTDNNGQAKLAIKLPAKKYTATIIYDGDDSHIKSTTTVKVVVNKASPKIIAKKKTFRVKTKIKKYIITLKDNKGKAFKNAKITLKVKGKTYRAITNSKGKATFKITKLTKKGKYKATVKYSGNKNFKSVAKTVKYITVKK